MQHEVRSSTAKLDQLIADDFIEIGSSGELFGKAEVLTWLPAEQSVTYTATDFKLQELAPNLIQLIYKSTCLNKDKQHYAQRSSIWKMNDSNWQMVFHQGTPCPPF